MVGKSTLKAYGFETMEDYYGMIVESHKNGQIRQLKEQFLVLAKDQRIEFLCWLADQYKATAADNWTAAEDYFECLQLLIKEIY